ncbi:hypothetical protein [Paracholeplasma manati]|uniref:hypothetical protein n=1 Tax=Paracholeplasma manati TaxID=591373 RepID=UPI002407BBDF|nr:hypothetical protein [Paracholeplasma manati]MDG0889000.1 hypothetical protein [Paracholeplasma manati]
MISREMCVLLDDFRAKKNLSMLNFIDGVVSLRQYKRYLYGTSEMPFKMFVELCDRVSVEPLYMVYELEHKRIDQANRLDVFSNAIIARDFDQAEALMRDLSKEVMIDQNNEIYFKLNILQLDYYLKKYPNAHLAKVCAELIHYPDILKHDVMNGVELVGLSLLLNFIPNEERFPIMDKLYQIIKTGAYTFISKDFFQMNSVSLGVAKMYGMNKDDVKVIELCNEVLKACDFNESYFNLDLTYYFLSLAHRNLGKTEEAHQYIEKLYHATKVKIENGSYDRFNALIKKDFGFDFETLLANKLKKY